MFWLGKKALLMFVPKAFLITILSTGVAVIIKMRFTFKRAEV